LNTLLYRATLPVTVLVETVSNNPVFAISIFVAVIVLPLIAMLRRSWLGTAVAGHVALGLAVWMMLNSADTRLREVLTAENVLDIGPEMIGNRVISFGAMAAAMFMLCIVNHIMFFRIASARA
jgi:hypothetical protein